MKFNLAGYTEKIFAQKEIFFINSYDLDLHDFRFF